MIGLRPPGMPFYDEAAPHDRPFAVPPDIVIDLPAPLSVNRTRKIDWRQQKAVKDWWRDAENMALMQRRKLPPPITGRYELIVTLHEGLRMDADNGLKILIDALRRFGLVADDSPKYLRRMTVEFGNVAGCRVTIRPIA